MFLGTLCIWRTCEVNKDKCAFLAGLGHDCWSSVVKAGARPQGDGFLSASGETWGFWVDVKGFWLFHRAATRCVSSLIWL